MKIKLTNQNAMHDKNTGKDPVCRRAKKYDTPFFIATGGILRKFWKECLLLSLLSMGVSALPVKDYNNPPQKSIILELFQNLAVQNSISHYPKIIPRDINTVYRALLQKAPDFNQQLLEHTITILACADQSGIQHDNVLTIIDYEKPSNEKRLWVFDLNQEKILYHTYVAHGLKNGIRLSEYFSNRYNSRASSIGLYRTQNAYRGREGLSLRLEGLENNFNNHAQDRAIVMHGGWYVTEDFIKKYDRAGRSWGCPAVPESTAPELIRSIAENTLLLAYYPDPQWLAQSQFLHCIKNTDTASNTISDLAHDKSVPQIPAEKREPIVYAAIKNKKTYVENNPVIAMESEEYKKEFAKNPPLNRMLRRQIAGSEYIVLSPSELETLTRIPPDWNSIILVIPQIIYDRGYYETHMQPVMSGTVRDIIKNTSEAEPFTLFLTTQKNPVPIKVQDGFIRWIGL